MHHGPAGQWPPSMPQAFVSVFTLIASGAAQDATDATGRVIAGPNVGAVNVLGVPLFGLSTWTVLNPALSAGALADAVHVQIVASALFAGDVGLVQQMVLTLGTVAHPSGGIAAAHPLAVAGYIAGPHPITPGQCGQFFPVATGAPIAIPSPPTAPVTSGYGDGSIQLRDALTDAYGSASAPTLTLTVRTLDASPASTFDQLSAGLNVTVKLTALTFAAGTLPEGPVWLECEDVPAPA